MVYKIRITRCLDFKTYLDRRLGPWLVNLMLFQKSTTVFDISTNANVDVKYLTHLVKLIYTIQSCYKLSIAEEKSVGITQDGMGRVDVLSCLPKISTGQIEEGLHFDQN